MNYELWVTGYELRVTSYVAHPLEWLFYIF